MIAQDITAENIALKQQLQRAMHIVSLRPLTVAEAGAELGISGNTVRDYAKRGILRVHPRSTPGKVLICASEVVRHSKEELRRMKRYKKWGLKA